ncbi:MAG: amidohydrolase family protein, partial [Streptosporangiaceae bacterium]
MTITSGAVPMRVFTDARIFTADAGSSWAEAVAVDGGRFTAVGSAAAVRAAVPPGTPEVGLGGRTVVPGFIDAHNHFAQTAHSLTWVDARYPGVSQASDLVTLIA